MNRCSITGCPRPHLARGWCSTHYARWRRNGDPTADFSLRGEAHYAWTGDKATYPAVHQRLFSQRGLARNHECAYCHEAADHWAYTHGDPNERVGDDGHGHQLTYSTDLSCYIALCASCHKRLDQRHLNIIEGVAS